MPGQGKAQSESIKITSKIIQINSKVSVEFFIFFSSFVWLCYGFFFGGWFSVFFHFCLYVDNSEAQNAIKHNLKRIIYANRMRTEKNRNDEKRVNKRTFCNKHLSVENVHCRSTFLLEGLCCGIVQC